MIALVTRSRSMKSSGLRFESATTENGARSMDWDVFVSHAGEDKEAVRGRWRTVSPSSVVRVWFDEFHAYCRRQSASVN